MASGLFRPVPDWAASLRAALWCAIRVKRVSNKYAGARRRCCSIRTREVSHSELDLTVGKLPPFLDNRHVPDLLTLAAGDWDIIILGPQTQWALGPSEVQDLSPHSHWNMWKVRPALGSSMLVTKLGCWPQLRRRERYRQNPSPKGVKIGL
jgi:hypothetical protein